MRKCKHRCPYDVSSVDILNEPEPRISLLGQRRCMDCGEVVPYGPANDTGEHAASVAVEVRGTMLADNWREQSYKPGADRFEWCPETKSDELCDLCQAHVLAHAIAEHTEGDQ